MVIVAYTIIDKSISYHQENIVTEKAITDFIALEPIDTVWRGTNKNQIPYETDTGKLIWYGYQLISNTSYYLGPKGIVANITNGMNCQNCHLEGGTIPFGNNFGKVYATYPQFRARNNGIQSIYGRVNDCLERSLNGKAIDSSSREMQAIYAYIKWLGNDVPKSYKSGGTSIMKIPFLPNAADPKKGALVYLNNCQKCHGADGNGQFNNDQTGYTYPPLWGANSYNDGAGLYRLSSFAGFVKNNMPFGIDYHKPILTNEEAWNVAAFVNSKPRPHKDQQNDWKKISTKPIDYPFGPYADSFTETQHKYGPFKAIAEYKK
jgi:thiosulfate dehydrogenase